MLVELPLPLQRFFGDRRSDQCFKVMPKRRPFAKLLNCSHSTFICSFVRFQSASQELKGLSTGRDPVRFLLNCSFHFTRQKCIPLNAESCLQRSDGSGRTPDLMSAMMVLCPLFSGQWVILSLVLWRLKKGSQKWAHNFPSGAKSYPILHLFAPAHPNGENRTFIWRVQIRTQRTHL